MLGGRASPAPGTPQGRSAPPYGPALATSSSAAALLRSLDRSASPSPSTSQRSPPVSRPRAAPGSFYETYSPPTSASNLAAPGPLLPSIHPRGPMHDPRPQRAAPWPEPRPPPGDDYGPEEEGEGDGAQARLEEFLARLSRSNSSLAAALGSLASRVESLESRFAAHEASNARALAALSSPQRQALEAPPSPPAAPLPAAALADLEARTAAIARQLAAAEAAAKAAEERRASAGAGSDRATMVAVRVQLASIESRLTSLEERTKRSDSVARTEVGSNAGDRRISSGSSSGVSSLGDRRTSGGSLAGGEEGGYGNLRRLMAEVADQVVAKRFEEAAKRWGALEDRVAANRADAEETAAQLRAQAARMQNALEASGLLREGGEPWQQESVFDMRLITGGNTPPSPPAAAAAAAAAVRDAVAELRGDLTAAVAEVRKELARERKRRPEGSASPSPTHAPAAPAPAGAAGAAAPAAAPAALEELAKSLADTREQLARLAVRVEINEPPEGSSFLEAGRPPLEPPRGGPSARQIRQQLSALQEWVEREQGAKAFDLRRAIERAENAEALPAAGAGGVDAAAFADFQRRTREHADQLVQRVTEAMAREAAKSAATRADVEAVVRRLARLEARLPPPQ